MMLVEYQTLELPFFRKIFSVDQTYKPKDYYDCTIFGYNATQDCDYLLFTQVLSDLGTVYVLGGYNKKRFLEDSTYIEAGSVVGTNNLTYKKDNYVMEIKDLLPMDKFRKEIA